MSKRNLFADPKFDRAIDLFTDACRQSRAHSKATADALEAYGDHGAQISGIIRGHFPECTKSYLRSLCRNICILSDAAYAARPKGVRFATMRTLAQEVARRDGSGFYGPRAI